MMISVSLLETCITVMITDCSFLCPPRVLFGVIIGGTDLCDFLFSLYVLTALRTASVPRSVGKVFKSGFFTISYHVKNRVNLDEGVC